MESSEDDAGTATSASRRASAREKDIEQAENTNATSSSLQQTSEARTSCETSAMSEENFDGDSVPSPTSHDANTSTEAILDMIDEIVDGPGAPKRLPLALDDVECASNSSNHPNIPDLPINDAENDTPQLPPASSAISAKSEQKPQVCVDVPPRECTSHNDSVSLNTVSVESPQTTTSAVEGVIIAESTLADDCAVGSGKSVVSSNCPPPNIPSSSDVETVHSISNVSECQTQDRTVKCVTSSDICDNVVVESAESTSCDNSTVDGKVAIAESVTRSPLRRRLVRPTISDRRPDSTVSSTVDVPTTEQSNSEHVTKDVSSSSDAVPTVHGNIKPEEISNLSEISVCKAETSVSPPKKIKLIRQRITSVASCRDSTQDKEVLLPELGQCQSTSQDSSEPTLPEPWSELCTAGTSSTQDVKIKNDLQNEVILNDTSINTPASNDCVSRREQPEMFKNSEDIPPISNETLSLVNIIESAHEKEDLLIKLDCSISESSALEVNAHAECTQSSSSKCDDTTQDQPESVKQIPKLTIKLSNKQSEEMKSPVPKLTIKPVKPPVDDINKDSCEQIPNVTKLNIKPIPKPSVMNDVLTRKSSEREIRRDNEDQIPLVTKINIKPILKPPEKINDVHRKSSSSEISESEYSENDESTSTSDQASASDQGSSNVIPKVTIKLGKPGTHCEGKFYTEKNVPKITIKGIQSSEKEDTEKNIPKLIIKGLQHSEKEELDKNIPKFKIKGIQHCEKDDQESVSKLKLVISQTEDKQLEKIPKLTIKTVSKSEGQPLSPKLTIKPLKPPDCVSKDAVVEYSDTQHIPKLKITTESLSSTAEIKENVHVPKITIKPVTRTDVDSKTPKKSTVVCDSSEHIPIVTKLTIKPILKPTDSSETSEGLEDKVPVVSKLYIKPVVKPKDNEVDSSVEDIPKITKLNIKPIKNLEGNTSEEKDCDELKTDDESSISVVTKLNIKPTVKHQDEDVTKDSENQSSETGNSSDDNTDIPVVTKINIKPVIKPLEDVKQKTSIDNAIPSVTKLTIKSVVKQDENISPSSPKRDSSKGTDGKITAIPVVTKLNIKPVMKPEDFDPHKSKSDDKLVKNPPLLMKINMKAVADTSSHENLFADMKVNNIDDNSEHICNNISEESSLLSKSDVKIKSADSDETKRISSESSELDRVRIDKDSIDLVSVKQPTDDTTHLDTSIKQNCVPEANEILDSLQSTKEGQPGCSLGETTSDLVVIDVSQNSLQTLLEKATSESVNVSPNPDKNETIRSSGKSDLNITHVETSVDSNTTSESSAIRQLSKQQMSSVKNCTLLKKLLETTDDGLDKRHEESSMATVMSNCSTVTSSFCKDAIHCEAVDSSTDKTNTDPSHDYNVQKVTKSPDTVNDSSIMQGTVNIRPIQEMCKEASENLKHPLEINVSEKIVCQSSGQDSPRIILKINKTDHGPSAKIITEEINKSDTLQQQDCMSDNTHEIVNDIPSPKKIIANSRRKPASNVTMSPVTMGKRLRSSRIVENTDKTPTVKRNVGKRPSTTDVSLPNSKEPELSTLETKRLKLGQLLSNKSLTITPVTKVSQTPPVNKPVDTKQGKTMNHTLLNNENCSKNGNSKLHNILSNLQAKQLQAMPLNDINCSDKSQMGTSEIDSNISSGSGDTVEIVRVENCLPEVQEMMISENCEFRDFSIAADDISQDPLEVDNSKPVSECRNDSLIIPKAVESTPQPKKRGRPRKLPLSEGAKPAPVAPTAPPIDERPQRSLRLYRDRPAIIAKPRGGRGRGRGGRRLEPQPEPVPIAIDVPATDAEPIDPTSSRIKLPRMTEALDKMPSACSTPLSSRRRSSADLKLFGETHEMNVVLDAGQPRAPSPERPVVRGRGRGGRGRARGGRSVLRTPRGRGRGRGGGRGAMYMKETLGIYGRVCGPATTTVQLFEEETCMMDDNATPAKPSHLLDEDSQSSVKSSTNESSKLKKSKFADLFDSNKVWTAADVKKYMWPPVDKSNEQSQVMMIQEQVAMFLSVKSFKRRYPELKRRTIMGEERDHVLSKGLVTEALCDLGITAVDASEVLDIMLSDYPHKYEEYRSHQRERQLAAPEEPEVKPEVKSDKIEMKSESKPAEIKPEPPKVDPEKTRQDMARAAIASASEWNARLNALRRPACVDLQTMTVQRRRPAEIAPATSSAPAASSAPAPPEHVRPPAGFYPHALLPGQYHHTYRCYTSDQLRYFPLNTVLAAAPAPPSPVVSSSDSEAECGSRSDDSSRGSDVPPHQKRKRLTKTKRISQAETLTIKKEEKEDSRDGDVDTCRVCSLRLEANRKYTHERFLVCANCNAKLHPGCVELSADTIRKCREYAWQCAECKSCCACRRPQDDDKMLFCDLCDRGFHIYCVGLDKVPSGRWHCVECAICKSCGARSPGGPPPSVGASGMTTPSSVAVSTPATPATPMGSVTLDTPGAAQWHHQTRRGPGGHKVYSHSLCTPCARAYRIGRYCPLCDRSFIGPKGTMQLVICKLCDRQLHQECVRATVSTLNVLDYTCGECRRGGITSRAAAVRLAPRTVATLFMAKRRFNKYAHRQYMASRLRAKMAPDDDASNDADVDADAEVSDVDAGDPLEGAGEPPPDAD